MSNSYYRSKAVDSFKTKLKIYIYSLVRNEQESLFSIEHFKVFVVRDEIVTEYTTIFWQQELTHVINNRTINDIYHAMKGIEATQKALITSMQKDYIENFTLIFPRAAFDSVTAAQTCHYCSISSEQIKQLASKGQLFKKNERGWKLELDRFNSNYEYHPDNCAMACYWCNNAKTDEFTEAEFKEIGKSIAKIWQKRLEKV